MLRRPAIALLAAVLCGLALALVGLVALATGLGHWMDEVVLSGLASLEPTAVGRVARSVVHLGDPAPFLVIALALVSIAVLRGRGTVGVAVGVMLVGAALTSQVLKPLLAEPRIVAWLGGDQIGPASWPSGHSTAAMALACALVLVVPGRLRPLAAPVGGAVATVVGLATVVLRWHFPSDVLGGFLVAALWTLLVVAVHEALLGGARAPVRPGGARGTVLASGLAVVAAVAVGASAAAADPAAALAFARDHGLALVGAGTIGALALGVAAGLSAGLGVGRDVPR